MAYISASIRFTLLGGQTAMDAMLMASAKVMSLCDDFNEGEDD